MSAGRIALLVIGIIVLLIGLSMAVVGGGMVGLSQAFDDENGYITSKTADLDSSSYAVISEPFDFEAGVSCWGRDWDTADFVTFSLEGSSNNGKALFMGIASESDVAGYLNDVPHDEVQHWASNYSRDVDIAYRYHPGTLAPASPAAQTFWETSVRGDGSQKLTWAPQSGRWVAVLMNEDGSAVIDVDGRIGAKMPWFFWAGLGVLVVGAILLVGGILMIVLAARNPRPLPR